MANIKGIRVDVDTDSEWWAPTTDALFLGVYGKNGGREFRLNENTHIKDSSEEYPLVLGDPCCPTENDIQVSNSTNKGDNDPLLNPIHLEDVDYVYLRKETADSTSKNDDALAFHHTSVLLCDREGKLRRFRKAGHLHFSDEAGLQHWLGETVPPYCQVTVRLTKIRHNDEAKLPAGRRWILTFGAGPTPNKVNILPYYYKKVKVKDRDEWEVKFNLSRSFRLEGCCGQENKVGIGGSATELDVLSKNDSVDFTKIVSVPCGHEAKATNHETAVIVQGGAKNRKSKVTFEYEISSVCVE